MTIRDLITLAAWGSVMMMFLQTAISEEKLILDVLQDFFFTLKLLVYCKADAKEKRSGFENRKEATDFYCETCGRQHTNKSKASAGDVCKTYF